MRRQDKDFTYEVDDIVIHPSFGCGRIIHLDSQNHFLVQFDNEHPSLHNGNSGRLLGREHRCWWCSSYDINFVARKIAKENINDKQNIF